MEEKELLTSIQADYLKATPEADAAAITAFCDFARAWLQKNAVIGVGQSAAGVALRFADSTERLLFSAANTDGYGGAFSITGQPGKSDRTAVDSNSVNITGR